MQGSLDFSNERVFEKYSSTFTLSDMEIFVFPELFYPLVLSNIMSPIIWSWRNDPWFHDIDKKSFTYKMNRIKQYIMEHYIFNLDLETWGLTNKDTEIERFRDFIDMNILKQSNALFGYEGDKYYFDLDIRRHFGLDKYTTDIIPYWKTETVEAMSAFTYKEGFRLGAGECVSLSALYAAALFIVGRIPIENIYLIATPLHSQNFIDMDEGVITNNRRILTKNMWYNGTPISEKGRRALEKEKVTIVSHISGYIHQIYKKATIDPQAYSQFTSKLKQYLHTELSWTIFLNFLRSNVNLQPYFQHKQVMEGQPYFMEMETVYGLEHKFRKSFSDQNLKSFFTDVPLQDFSTDSLPNRIVLQDVENIFDKKQPLNQSDFLQRLKILANQAQCPNQPMFETYLLELLNFMHTDPKLPTDEKQFISCERLHITVNQSREEIIQKISENARSNEVSLLALYTYRDMDFIDWKPFIKAAFERNPISVNGLKGRSIQEAYHSVNHFVNESIYDANRLAMPDEVWNFGRGDGVEKAILLANYIHSIDKNWNINLIIENSSVTLLHQSIKYAFVSNKLFSKALTLYNSYQESCCKCC